MRRVLVERWFLIGLLLAVSVGIAAADHLAVLAQFRLLPRCVVACVMFVMALPLETHAVLQALRRPLPPLLASGVNLGLLPATAWAVAGLLSDEMGPGLLVAATTPCTLASAAVWTRRAGGNDAVAILVTILTNSVCFVVTPLWLMAMTGRVVDSPALSLRGISVELAVLVVLPMIVAQLVRLLPLVAAVATRRKVALGVLAQCGILTMVFLGSIHSGLRLGEEAPRVALAWDLTTMLLAVLGVHLAMLYAGIRLARWCGLSREDQIAVGFAGSQKTLMIGLLLAISLQVTILPMVTYHVSQLVADTLIADRFRRRPKPV